MNRNLTRVAVFVVAALLAGQAAAWRSVNSFGGSTEHMAGVGTEHTNAWGGSTEHAFGGGTEHTNVYGGSTEGRYGDGVEHTNVYGGTTEARYGDGAYHTAPDGATVGVSAYHPYPAPVAVPYYSAAGCYGCAAAAGAVVGAAVGAAAVSTASASAASTMYMTGTNYASLPAGCNKNSVNGSTYYLCGNTWFQPSYGANGVYYQVVPNPW
jgi:hypothetical protein